MPNWAWVVILLLLLWIVSIVRARRRRRQLDEADTRSFHRWQAEHANDETWNFHAYKVGMPTTAEAWVRKRPDGELEVTAVHPQLKTVLTILFTRQQQRAGEPLWWPELAQAALDAREGSNFWQTNGWSYDGPGTPSPRMLDDYTIPLFDLPE